MMPAALFTGEELDDSFLAGVINARFNSFMSRFSADLGLNFNVAMLSAREILRSAEIPQPGDDPEDTKLSHPNTNQ